MIQNSHDDNHMSQELQIIYYCWDSTIAWSIRSHAKYYFYLQDQRTLFKLQLVVKLDMWLNHKLCMS